MDLGCPGRMEAAGPIVPTDKGYQGAAHAKVPYKCRNNRNRGKRLTVLTRNSAPPGKGRTPRSRLGRSSGNSVAALGRPTRSPKPSMSFKPVRHNQLERALCPGPTR
jgi:hypothetical protein